jgi:hypothetical protein
MSSFNCSVNLKAHSMVFSNAVFSMAVFFGWVTFMFPVVHGEF